MIVRMSVFVGRILAWFLLLYGVSGQEETDRYTNDVLICLHGEDRDPPHPGDHAHLYDQITPTKDQLPGKSCFIASRKTPERFKRSADYTPEKIHDDEIDHAFKRHDGVAFANQLVYKKRELRADPNDTRWNDQWNLNVASPSMRVQEAWARGYNGSSITVAVVDNGIQMDHPDLVNKLNQSLGYDFVRNQTDVSPSYFRHDHGTKVAGIIGAEKDNNECIAGISHGVTLVGILLFEGITYSTDYTEGSAFTHELSLIDIYSNSWGPPSAYGFPTMGPFAYQSLLKGITQGRNGKGAIYVFAAGNSHLDDNCNADGYVNLIYTIAISSVARNREPPDYAEVCAPALAVAYSGSDTDTLVSTNTLDRCSIGLEGTSFSAPQASAVIALALGARSELTWRDVQHLIVLTTKHDNLTENAYGWGINGEGKHYSQVLGFGLLDADAMVTEASTWTLVSTQLTENSTANTVVHNLNSTVSSVTDSVVISSSPIKHLEHVQLTVVAQCSQRKNLEIDLTSPQGTTSRLLTRRKYDTATSEIDFTFMSVHYWAEDPDGAWNLTVTISNTGDTGYLKSWYLTLYGISTPPVTGRDYCAAMTCHNGATCDNRVLGGVCQCVFGFTGEFCETDINECESGPCEHGSCIDDIGKYVCNCTGTGYTGTECQTDIDECSLATPPCQNGGVCTNQVPFYDCNCGGTGFTGNNCETDIDECLSSPCQHGQCMNEVNQYSCNCSNTGYTGTQCQTDIDECASNPCQNGGTCSNEENHYTCNCAGTGYSGTECQTDIDECSLATPPCQNGGVCTNQVPHYDCNCGGTGFTGNNCETDIDECTSNPCQNGGTCSNEVNQYTCNCAGTGYSGTECQTDVDECVTDLNICENNGTCDNLVGSFSCNCSQTDFNGTHCDIPIDDCFPGACAAHEKCVDELRDYRCVNKTAGDQDKDEDFPWWAIFLCTLVGAVVGGAGAFCLWTFLIAPNSRVSASCSSMEATNIKNSVGEPRATALESSPQKNGGTNITDGSSGVTGSKPATFSVVEMPEAHAPAHTNGGVSNNGYVRTASSIILE